VVSRHGDHISVLSLVVVVVVVVVVVIWSVRRLKIDVYTFSPVQVVVVCVLQLFSHRRRHSCSVQLSMSWLSLHKLTSSSGVYNK